MIAIKFGKAVIRALAEHFSLPLSQYKFDIDLALIELNGVKMLQ